MLTMKKSSSCPSLHRNNSTTEEQQIQPMAIDNNNVEAGPILAPSNNLTYNQLKAEVMELFRMLKLTHAGNQHLVSALQMNQTLPQLQQFHRVVEDEINAQLHQELNEFEELYLWNAIAIDEIAIPWNQ
ncbi:hypothetical protein RHGRI_022695 [Rhododendron griersonianum]|uniref:Uncharacterized protein n=1 Tax=Rhododendron griersonianum TaxID=479676 RepID=A0AAV6J3G6_9ERIC|nr:hypothetical protein RHGRI_022301 [Rhododendron griersonianum]KAG5534656.1 hypothetical protein RHGRI_022695 [Rhododendron griersonianum]